MLDIFPSFTHSFAPSSVTAKRSKFPTTYRSRVKNRFYSPTFTTANIWRGASEIVGVYCCHTSSNLSFLTVAKSQASNYCLCVSWKNLNGTVSRYKLWQDVGEVLYLPVYSGQIIAKDFTLEIWSVNSVTISGGGDNILTSFLTSQTDSPIIDAQIDFTECSGIDIAFDLTNFVPLIDGWDIGFCGATTIVVVSPKYALLNLLCPADNTWHEVTLISIETFPGSGIFITDVQVTQANAAPGTTPYISLIQGAFAYKFQIAKTGGGTYTYDVGEIVVDANAVHSFLLLSSDLFFYPLALTLVEGAISLYIGQTGYV